MRWVRGLAAVLFAVLVLCWLGYRTGRLAIAPGVLAAGAAVLLGLLAAEMVGTVRGMVRSGERRGPAVGRLMLVAGLVLAGGGGLANWLLSVQGFVILGAPDAVPLAGGRHLQELEAGPLARPAELDVVLQLEKLELEPTSGGFVPESRLRVQRPSGPVEVLSVRPGSSARSGPLWFHQGAFGFAPRIVILRDGATVFDREVPFTTTSHGGGRVSFDGEFTIEREELHVAGRVDLSTLDEAMRGHAALQLRLARGGRDLGEGRLLPGHFATLDDGYRVGYAGLGTWSEIDISRRGYAGAVLGGCGLALAGMLWWAVARGRRA